MRATNARIAVVAAERIADLERALATIRGSTLDATAVPALRDQLSSLDFYPGLDTDSPVLAEFIGTGNLRVVQDPRLRVRINEMAALLGEIKRDDSAHFDMFLRIRADTHRALILTPTDTWVERIESTAAELLSNSTLDYVISYSIELYTVNLREWQETDETVLAIRNEIAEAYGLAHASR